MITFRKVQDIRCSGSDRKLMTLAAKIQKSFPVLYVGCANTFDPYLLYRVCRDESVLDRVYVARPFTVYQLRELVFQKLEKTIQRLFARFLLVSKVDCYEADSPLDEEEYKTIHERVCGRIKSLTSDYGLCTFISYAGGDDPWAPLNYFQNKNRNF